MHRWPGAIVPRPCALIGPRGGPPPAWGRALTVGFRPVFRLVFRFLRVFMAFPFFPTGFFSGVCHLCVEGFSLAFRFVLLGDRGSIGVPRHPGAFPVEVGGVRWRWPGEWPAPCWRWARWEGPLGDPALGRLEAQGGGFLCGAAGFSRGPFVKSTVLGLSCSLGLLSCFTFATAVAGERFARLPSCSFLFPRSVLGCLFLGPYRDQ